MEKIKFERDFKKAMKNNGLGYVRIKVNGDAYHSHVIFAKSYEIYRFGYNKVYLFYNVNKTGDIAHVFLRFVEEVY